jgi:hypothetical protein
MRVRQAIIKEAGRRERALKKEAAETEVEWQLYANRLKNDKADAMREMDRSRREELVELTRLRKEADARYAELNEALAHEFDASERLREMRGGSSWAKQRRVLEEEAAALKKRRTLNQRRISDANLADQRAKAATEARQRIEEHVTDAWRSEAIVSSVDYHALQAELTRTRLDLEAQKMETAKYKAIAEPPKEYFFKSGHFSAPVDLACLQTLQLGVTRSKAPALFLVFARLFRITLPSREKKVPGPWVDGKRTTQVRIKLYVPGTTHLKHVAGMMYELNKLQVGQWLVEYLESDETSCCYLADGAESDQVEKLGQALARRINGKLELKALDLNAISSKTGEAQAAAFTDSIEAVAELMERAGMVDARLKELLRRFIPTCSQNDRAANGRLAARRVVGLADGDDDPTCGIHALVNILEEGRKAMDSVLHELMNITAEQAEADASKVKAMRTCVGWFSSPACALIYQVAKYVALCSTKGYAIGKKYREWFEARLADLEEVLEELEETIERRRSDLLAGHAEDLQAICGGRLFVFWIDASVTERLLTPGPLSLLTYLDEEEELQAAGGGKLRKSILTGARSECMASLRAMSIVTDVVFWKMVKALQPSADKHVLDVLPTVWPNAHAFFTAAAASPASLYDKSLTLDVGVDIGTNIGAQTVATGTTASHAGRRSERARLDMERIYAKAKDDPLVERLLTAAFTAFAKATANHASEFLPAGLERTDGTIGGAGKLCKANITPELLARYDALVATSIPVERLHAIGRHVDDRCKKQRVDARAGISLAIFNDQGGWACATADADMSQLERQMDAAREEAAKARKMTMKAMRIGEGRAKRAERDRQLGGKRARKEKKKAERARLETVKLATHYSQLTAMPIIGEGSLQEQLKVQKLAGKTGFTVTQKDRAAYVTQLQALIFAAEGAKANDLDDGDSGCGAERVVRKRRAASESTGAAKSGKKREEMETLDLGDGRVWTWPKSEVFEIERILDTRMVTCKVGSVRDAPCNSAVAPPSLAPVPTTTSPPSVPLFAGEELQDERLRAVPHPLEGLPAGVRDVAVAGAARREGRRPTRRRGRVRGWHRGRGAAGCGGGGGGRGGRRGRRGRRVSGGWVWSVAGRQG